MKWHRQAACAALESVAAERLFFPLGTVDPEAQRLCAECPVRAECRAEADAIEGRAPETYLTGFRAGETTRQRVRRRRREATA